MRGATAKFTLAAAYAVACCALLTLPHKGLARHGVSKRKHDFGGPVEVDHQIGNPPLQEQLCMGQS